MDLSAMFQRCNTIEELFMLTKWQKLDLFMNRLRKIHSAMSDSNIYDTFWEVMYKITMQIPLYESRLDQLFCNVQPYEYPFIRAYVKDVYNTIGDTIVEKPDNISDPVFKTGILMLMLSMDDADWNGKANADFSWPAYVLELLNFFCEKYSRMSSAVDLERFLYDNPDIFVLNFRRTCYDLPISMRAIIDQFVSGNNPNIFKKLYDADMGPNFIEDCFGVFGAIARFYKNLGAYELDKEDMHQEVYAYFFNEYRKKGVALVRREAVYDAYKEDFAWEASGIDGMIGMMDHITFACTSFPKDVAKLDQEIINDYVNNLINYVVSTSKMINVDNFFTYIRDILNLVIPRVDKFPDTRLYIDAALNSAQFPTKPLGVGNKKDPFISNEAIYATEWYHEMHSFAMEASRQDKRRDKNDEDEEDNEQDEDEIDSGSDIQKQSKKNSSVSYNAASNKIYSAYKKVERRAGIVDSNLDTIAKGLKKCLVGDVTAAVIDGKKITPIEALIRVLGTGAIFRYNKIAGIIAIVVQYAAKKACTDSERKKILIDLERELEIIEEKIEDAKGDGNKQAKYAMMRTRNDLKTAIQRIKYNLPADDRANATAQAVVKANNPRRM